MGNPLNERSQRQLKSILVKDRFSIDDVEESLTAAMGRKGSKVTEQAKIIGLEAAESVFNGRSLTDTQKSIIEGIVIGNGLRPAIDVEDDTFDPLPGIWDDINEVRGGLTSLIRGVGRVNLVGHPKVSFAGTAFVCGHNLIMTNRHVAEEFMAAKADAFQLAFKPGMSASIDTKEEVDSSISRVLTCTGEGVVSAEWDVALLRVEALPQGMAPVPMSSAVPNSLQNRTAVTVGYPAFDESESLLEQLQIFRGVFSKKRLLPGKFTDFFPVQSFGQSVDALAHDCTTLGGCSGSSVIDVQTLKVFGVHFGGHSGIRNYCVPTWKLAEIPAFKSFRDQMSFA